MKQQVFASISAILLVAAWGSGLAMATVRQDGPYEAQTQNQNPILGTAPRPIQMDDPRPLPSQVISVGRLVFSADGAPLGVVRRIVATVSDERRVEVCMGGGMVKAVPASGATVSDGGVVIVLTKLEVDAIDPLEAPQGESPLESC